MLNLVFNKRRINYRIDDLLQEFHYLQQGLKKSNGKSLDIAKIREIQGILQDIKNEINFLNSLL